MFLVLNKVFKTSRFKGWQGQEGLGQSPHQSPENLIREVLSTPAPLGRNPSASGGDRERLTPGNGGRALRPARAQTVINSSALC